MHGTELEPAHGGAVPLDDLGLHQARLLEAAHGPPGHHGLSTGDDVEHHDLGRSAWLAAHRSQTVADPAQSSLDPGRQLARWRAVQAGQEQPPETTLVPAEGQSRAVRRPCERPLTGPPRRVAVLVGLLHHGKGAAPVGRRRHPEVAPPARVGEEGQPGSVGREAG